MVKHRETNVYDVNFCKTTWYTKYHKKSVSATKSVISFYFFIFYS